jgi:glutathione S-transferase
MHDLLSSPAFNLYALASTVLALHLLALALWTGTLRTLRKQYVNPEDAALNKAEKADADHPDVARTRRAHANALENALPFFVVGALYALSGATRTGALVYFSVFVAARLLHSVFYLWGRQPWRTLMFVVGVLDVIGMAVQVLRAVA